MLLARVRGLAYDTIVCRCLCQTYGIYQYTHPVSHTVTACAIFLHVFASMGILFAFQQNSWLSILKDGFILDRFDGDSQPFSP